MNDKEPKASETPEQRRQAERYIASRPDPYYGNRSNDIITRRNGGVRHQFIDSIGGDSSNYR